MRAYIVSAYADTALKDRFEQLAKADRIKRHASVNGPEDADIILFIESSHYDDDFYFSTLRKHALVHRYREKCFMYNEQDRPWCVLPGLYCSMPSPFFERSRQRAVPFIGVMNKYVEAAAQKTKGFTDTHYLFSFMGSNRGKFRKEVFLLKDRSAGYVEDTTRLNMFDCSANSLEDALRKYVEVMQGSSFILCPRGSGTSTFRIFEAMELGRAPVIIADQWVPPEGPDWDTFAMRIPERRVADIPNILDSCKDSAEERGRLARMAWEQWFGPEKIFDYCMEQCAGILKNRRVPERIAHYQLSIPCLTLHIKGIGRPVVKMLRNMIPTMTNKQWK
jgi:hypothetical protein